jgi:glutamate dehydrogenase
MTDDVAAHVLKDNYEQSLALSLQERRSANDLAEHIDFMRALERQGFLNRKLEGLPDDDRIQQLIQLHHGLTRPELCVLLAYSKMSVYNQIMESGLPDDPEMLEHLIDYFPPNLQEKFRSDIPHHKLKREIIGTVLVNVIINRMGSVFVAEEIERGGYTAEQIIRAWLLVRNIFDLQSLWQEMNGLDNKIPAVLQLKLYQDISDAMHHGTKWFLQHYGDKLSDKKLLPLYRDQLVGLQESLPQIVPQNILEQIGVKLAEIEPHDAITPELKKRLLQLSLVMDGCDIIYLTQITKAKAEEVAKAYFTLNGRLKLSSIAAQLDILPAETPWAEEAIETLKDEVQNLATDVTKQFLDSRGKVEELEEWLAQRQAEIDLVDTALKDFERITVPDLSLLTVLVQRLRRFAYPATGDNHGK